MIDLRQYTKKFTMEFIELYKQHPSLWQVKNKDYRDRAKKAAAYEILVHKCREVEPDCDKDTVVRKINSLRNCYRKELNKVKKSLKSRDLEVYKPTLWYFDLLSFLNNDNLLSEGSNTEEDSTHEFNDGPCDPVSFNTEPLKSECESTQSSPTFSFVSTEPSSLQKRKRPKEEPSQSFTEQQFEEDEFDLLGKLYANKLKKLEKTQRIYAEKIINDTLFEAQLGNLNRECRLVTKIRKSALTSEIELKPEYFESDTADTSYID